jgi:hypothetical protein
MIMVFRKYTYNNNFLPEKGVVMVDTSGLMYVPNQFGDFRDRLEEISRMEDFYPLLKKRGRVFTTPLVFDEIASGVDHYVDNYYISKDDIGSAESYGGRSDLIPKLYDKKDMNLRGAYIIAKICGVLKQMRIPYDSVKDGISYSEIKDYFENSNFNIGEVDMELLSSATFTGNGTSILSGDIYMMRAFKSAMRHFSLDGLICDAIDCTVKPAMFSLKN